MHIRFRLHYLIFGLTKKLYRTELGEVSGGLLFRFVVYVRLVW